MKPAFAFAALAVPAVAAAQSCRIDVAPIAFGAYDPAHGAPLVVRGDVALVCAAGPTTKPAGGSIAIRIAGDAARTLGPMHGGLRYALYRDAALTQPWWSGATLVLSLPDAAAGRQAELHVPVYARIAPGQWIAPGTYQDTVELTVEF